MVTGLSQPQSAGGNRNLLSSNFCNPGLKRTFTHKRFVIDLNLSAVATSIIFSPREVSTMCAFPPALATLCENAGHEEVVNTLSFEENSDMSPSPATLALSRRLTAPGYWLVFDG